MSWESTPREAPQGANWRKFRAYLDGSVKLTQQARTDLNNTLKTYEQMKKMDAKTQDKYEAEISTLQRQINDLSGQLKIANQTIHEGADDETPAPVLHMMNRLADVETKYIALRNRCVDAIVENTCYSAIGGLGLDCHNETCPPEQSKTNLEEIMMNICQDVADQNELCDQDYLNEEVDTAREEAYDDGHSAGCDYQEEESNNDFINKLNDLFGEGEGDWEDRLEAIAKKVAEGRGRDIKRWQMLKSCLTGEMTPEQEAGMEDELPLGVARRITQMKKELEEKDAHWNDWLNKAFGDDLYPISPSPEPDDFVEKVKALEKELADREKKCQNYMEFVERSDCFSDYADWIWEYRKDAPESQTGVDMFELAVEKLEQKFSTWQCVQCATNPQYGLTDEIHFLLGEDQEGAIAKRVFDDLYPGQYTLNIKDRHYNVPGDDDYDGEE